MASFEPQDFGLDEPPPRPTTPPVRRGFLLVLAVLCLAAALVYGIPHVAEQAGYAWESGRSRAAVEALARLDKAGVIDRSNAVFRLATAAVSPAVVNIQTEKFRRERRVPELPLGGAGPRFERGPIESFGIGSGVVIDKARGYVVTNNHVINEADQITVRLSQGAEVSARLVGADPKTDLAVLQIKGPLRVAAEWGDSDKLAPGDAVLAIGSPYMLDHTVTAGIVSATGRNNLILPGMDESSYQDFIQTDAAINPGNSGGPLVDINGKVVGINTAILTSSSFMRGDDAASQSGGFEGIGLAIPASMARRVVEALIKTGKVARGYLGVLPQPLTPALAERLKVPDTKGAFLANVQPGTPAERAGLQVGDVVVKIGGKDIADHQALRIRTGEIAPGTPVDVEYFRGGDRKTIKVILGEQPAERVAGISPFGFGVRELPAGAGGDPLGGVVIEQVARGSPASRARLHPGLRILAVGDTEVHSKADFDRAIAAYTPEKGLPLRIQRPDGGSIIVTIGGIGNGPR
jgi:serine protease Do